jgi:starch synthase
MNVLITGYEVSPFFKRGGLGDVMGSLPKALNKIGVDCRVVVPCYVEMLENANGKRIGEFYVHFGDKEEEVGVYKSYLPDSNCVVYFLSNKPILSHINLRGRNKKIDQFAFFSLAVVHLIAWLMENKKWEVNLVHCNDWHTALVPLIMKNKIKPPIPTLLTIHNLSYQGFGSRKVLDLLHFKNDETKELKREIPTKEIDILGEGILHATKVSTVSPNYALEIVREEHCHREIYGYLRKREAILGKDGKIIGILNGIDYDVWNPEKDNVIPRKYGVSDWEEGKKAAKEDLLKFFSLEPKTTFCFVGRMAVQKGIDVLIKVAKTIVQKDANLILLGSGDPNIEKSVKRIAQKYPKNIRAEVNYNEELSHKLYAGSDFILIPSNFEPCGLIQMIAMRYGTIPVASKTGGLQDSILNGKDGFLFEKGKSFRLRRAIKYALIVKKEGDRYKKMVQRAMKKDFSWDKSAVLYKNLYRKMLH